MQNRTFLLCADTNRQPAISTGIERYILTGETDPLYPAWPGRFMERANLAHSDLRDALVRAVQGQSQGLSHEPLPYVDTVALTRAKVEPMVRGLFPREVRCPRDQYAFGHLARSSKV